MFKHSEIVNEAADGDFVINVGPQHPATHGVLHLLITLNGETIKKVEPHLGYIHRSIEKMCESIELILNSVNLNFIAFNKYLWPHKMDGLFFTIFIIAIAAAEAAVAIAIIINVYRNYGSIDVEQTDQLKH